MTLRLFSKHIAVAVPGPNDGGFFDEGVGPIFLDDVACTGSESDLTQCDHNGIGNHNCNHGDDVGVICAGDYPNNCMM